MSHSSRIGLDLIPQSHNCSTIHRSHRTLILVLNYTLHLCILLHWGLSDSRRSRPLTLRIIIRSTKFAKYAEFQYQRYQPGQFKDESSGESLERVSYINLLDSPSHKGASCRAYTNHHVKTLKKNMINAEKILGRIAIHLYTGFYFFTIRRKNAPVLRVNLYWY